MELTYSRHFRSLRQHCRDKAKDKFNCYVYKIRFRSRSVKAARIGEPIRMIHENRALTEITSAYPGNVRTLYGGGVARF